MSKAKILIISTSPDGYRRGGVALDQGDNLFDQDQFSEDQLRQLGSDPRLVVGEAAALEETDQTANTKGTVEPERLAELVKHIQSLDKDDASLWKDDGTPKAAAFPKGTKAEEREAAWGAFVEQLDGAK